MAIENILQESEKNEFISILQKLRHGEAINAEEWSNIKNVREQLICMQYINSQLEYSEDSSEQMEQLFKNFFSQDELTRQAQAESLNQLLDKIEDNNFSLQLHDLLMINNLLSTFTSSEELAEAVSFISKKVFEGSSSSIQDLLSYMAHHYSNYGIVSLLNQMTESVRNDLIKTKEFQEILLRSCLNDGTLDGIFPVNDQHNIIVKVLKQCFPRNAENLENFSEDLRNKYAELASDEIGARMLGQVLSQLNLLDAFKQKDMLLNKILKGFENNINDATQFKIDDLAIFFSFATNDQLNNFLGKLLETFSDEKRSLTWEETFVKVILCCHPDSSKMVSQLISPDFLNILNRSHNRDIITDPLDNFRGNKVRYNELMKQIELYPSHTGLLALNSGQQYTELSDEMLLGVSNIFRRLDLSPQVSGLSLNDCKLPGFDANIIW
ncbi:MAG: hypothetical protein VX335_04365 [Pseudomonadota bacterium]|nr:hypothetical protein [Pseudomonadota bacterium]